MKKAYIIHGWGGSPTEPLHLWITSKLKEKGFDVIVPEMPNPEEPQINSWVLKISEIATELNEETYFIGHSIGCQAILRFLTKNKKVGKIILIAPWIKLKGLETEEEREIAKPWIETPIEFDKIMASEVIAIFSDNDPFVPIEEFKLFKQKLNAKIIIEKNKGHFTNDDKITELPVLLDYI